MMGHNEQSINPDKFLTSNSQCQPLLGRNFLFAEVRQKHKSCRGKNIIETLELFVCLYL